MQNHALGNALSTYMTFNTWATSTANNKVRTLIQN